MYLLKKTNFIIICLLFISIPACKKKVVVSSQMKEVFYIRNGSSDMPAWVRGNGESKVLVVVLHGGPGGDALSYRRAEAYQKLEEKYALVYWDQRHQGNSHGHLKDEEVTLDEMTGDLDLLVKTLKKRYGEGNSIFLLAHSWGGGLGTAFLIKDNYQDNINGWINMDGGYDIQRQNVGMMNMINTIGQEEIDAGSNVNFWKESIAFTKTIDTNNISFEKFKEINEYTHKIEDNLTEAQVNPIKMLDSYGITDPFFSSNNFLNSMLMGFQLPNSFLAGEFGKLNLTPHLAKIKTPSLIIYGKYDFVVPPILGQIMYDKISSSVKELKIYESSAHSPMAHEMDKFLDDVMIFINQNK